MTKEKEQRKSPLYPNGQLGEQLSILFSLKIIRPLRFRPLNLSLVLGRRHLADLTMESNALVEGGCSFVVACRGPQPPVEVISIDSDSGQAHTAHTTRSYARKGLQTVSGRSQNLRCLHFPSIPPPPLPLPHPLLRLSAVSPVHSVPLIRQ